MVFIAGGTGRLGTRVVGLLTNRRMRLRVLTRDRARAAHLPRAVEILEGDVRDPGSLHAAVAGATTVISSIQGLDDRRSSPEATDRDGNRNLIEAARAAGVDHFVLVSALYAGPDHPMSINRAKYAAEQFLKRSGLGWTIIRPPAFMEFWATLVGKPLLDTGRTRVFGRGDNPVNFVSIGDVATAVEKAVVDPALRGVELDMGGPENLTLNQVVELFERVSGKKGKVSHSPVPALRVMSILIRPINPAMARLTQASIVNDTMDMTWDPSANRGRYPWLPQTPLSEVLKKEMAPPAST
jgi:NADH dehydrogenase